MSLNDVDHAAYQSLQWLGPAPANWIPNTPGADLDVAVIGAGQCGIAIAHGLQRAGIANFEVFDGADAANPGVWRSRAYMNALRTPKTNRGPDLGNPALTFRAWYEGLHGEAAYAAFDVVPRDVWDSYLAWLRKILAVRVSWGTRLVRVEPQGNLLVLHLERDGAAFTKTARKLVVATGIDGGGAANIPGVIPADLPASLFAHSYERFDFAALRNKRIGILGAASSAFDIAASALESGAASARLFSRRAALAHSTHLRATAYPGIDGFHALPDADRWEISRRTRLRGPAPSRDTVLRAVAHDNFHLHLEADWRRVVRNGREVMVWAGDEVFSFDFIVAGTGFIYDPALQPALAPLAADIALWQDRYTPPAEFRDALLGRFPYLGSGYEFTEKVPGAAPHVRNIHLFTPGAQASFGRVVSDVASLATGVPRLVGAITEAFVREDRAHHLARMTTPPPDDLTGAEYAAAIWRPPAVTVASAGPE